MSAPRHALRPPFDPEMRDYLLDRMGPEDALVDRMQLYAREREFPIVGAFAGRWLEMLARMVDARRVLEVGSGFGYSAFFFARAVGEQGRVIGLEHHEHELLAFDVLYAGHPYKERIQILNTDGDSYLAQCEELFDVVFVDAEKEDYASLLDAVVPRVRPGGLVIYDNALWGGRVTIENPEDASTRGVQAFLEKLFAHPGLDAQVLPAGDGLAVGRKRGA